MNIYGYKQKHKNIKESIRNEESKISPNRLKLSRLKRARRNCSEKIRELKSSRRVVRK